MNFKLRKLNVKQYLWSLILAFLFVMSLLIPCVSNYKYFEQNLELVDLPPILKLKKLDDTYGVYIHKNLYPVVFLINGKVTQVPKCNAKKLNERKDYYLVNNRPLIFDYSGIKNFTKINYDDVKIIYNNSTIDDRRLIYVWNTSNIFGTDSLGRDIFTRIFEGIKISFIIGFVASLVNMVIGVVYGGIAGYVGGKLDILMLGFLNVIYSIPSVLMTILLSILMKPGVLTIIIVIGCVYWVSMARQVRAEVMAIKQKDFILAEKILGLPAYKIFFKHIIPNIKEVILTTLLVNVQNAIFTEAYLSFLGLGLPAPIASLGMLINDAVSNFRSSSYQLIIPFIAIVLIFICLDKIINVRKNINLKDMHD